MTLKVAVLLSYFNGGEWIADQLSSINALSGSIEVDVWVRDDGSIMTDRKMLEKRSEELENIRVIIFGGDSRIGVASSFFELLKVADGYDCYAFCDQDDYWYSNKIADQLSLLLSANLDSAVAIFSDSIVVDSFLVNGRGRYLDFVGMPRSSLSCWDYLFVNNVTGNSLLISRGLRKLILEIGKPQRMIMHDWWVALTASFLGELIFIDKPLLLYRQHSLNSIGATTIWHRLLGLLGGIQFRFVSIERRLSQARDFKELAGSLLDDETRSRLDKLLDDPFPIQCLRLLWIRVKMVLLSAVSRINVLGI